MSITATVSFPFTCTATATGSIAITATTTTTCHQRSPFSPAGLRRPRAARQASRAARRGALRPLLPGLYWEAVAGPDRFTPAPAGSATTPTELYNDQTQVAHPARSLGHEPTLHTGPGPAPAAPDQAAAPPRPSGELAPGATIGRYQIERLLGEGGMGAVFAAYDPQLDRRVAIKVLHVADAGAQLRLLREAQALARLEHPNVVTVYDSGEHHGAVFLAMQLFDGHTLADELADGGRDAARVVPLFLAAGRGLAAAHGAGLIHRDFKPANVLVDRAGRVAVTDFGLARASDDPDEAAGLTPRPDLVELGSASQSGRRRLPEAQLTRVGALVGTPTYMAPEQHAGGTVTARSDQFAFCVALWEALYQQHPILDPAVHQSSLASSVAIMAGELRPAPAGVQVPPRIDQALRRGLAVDPGQRWPTMEALLTALAPPPARARRWPWLLAMVGALGVGGAAAALVLTRGHADDQPCAEVVAERLLPVWSPAAAAQVRARLATTEVAFAERAASRLVAQVDGFTTRWRRQAVEVCVAGRVATAVPARVQAHQQDHCLSQALAQVEALTEQVGRSTSAEALAGLDELAATLPPLARCARADATSPVPALTSAPMVEAVTRRLDRVRLALRAAHLSEAERELGQLRPIVARLDWRPLRGELERLAGEVAVEREQAQPDQLVSLAGDASLDGDDHVAARAWGTAMTAAAQAGNHLAARSLATMAQATAERAGDARTRFEVRRTAARALMILRRFRDAEQVCRELPALAGVLPEGAELAAAQADKCLLDSLIPQGAWGQTRPLAERLTTTLGQVVGDDHPLMASLLHQRAETALREGHPAEARTHAERAMAIAQEVYGIDAPRSLVLLDTLAWIDLADKQVARARTRLEHVLSRATGDDPGAIHLRYTAHRSLGYVASAEGDMAASIREFDAAIPLARRLAGPRTAEVALLMLQVGQFKSMRDVDAGLALLAEAVEILEETGDRRAALARAARATVLWKHDRCAEAVPIYERGLREADTEDLEPGNRARLRWGLASCLDELGVDIPRTIELVDLALVDFARAGEDWRQSGAEFLRDLRKKQAAAERRAGRRRR